MRCVHAKPSGATPRISVDACYSSKVVTKPATKQLSMKHALAASALSVFLTHAPAVQALGLESIDLPTPSTPEVVRKMAERNNKVLSAAEEEFQNSDLLNILKRNSEENREKNKKSIENKYCKRQAELGVGDCGGLRYIPGATESGKQRTPDWLAKILGIEAQPETPKYNFFDDD